MAGATTNNIESPRIPATELIFEKSGSNGEAISSHSSGKDAEGATIETVQLSEIDANANDTNPDALPDGTQYPTGLRFWLLMINLGGIIILGGLDMMIVATAVPQITDHFHTVADIGWYSVAYRLCTCTFSFLYAYDQYGKSYKLFSVKRVFLLANALSFLGSLLSATAVSSSMLVGGRAVAGIGNAGLSVGAMLILVQSTPLRKRPTIMGLWAAVEGLSGIAGPLLGGALTQTIGWRWCFWINLPIGGATLLLTFLLYREIPKTGDVVELSFKDKLLQLDFISNLLLIPALTCLFLALNWAGTTYSWGSGRVIGLLVTAGVLSGAFVYSLYRRGDHAALPIRIMKRRTVFASVLFVVLWNSAGNVFEYYLPIYYQVVRAYNPAQSGLLMLPYLAAATLAAIGAGIAIGACGYYVPFMILASILVPVAAGLATTFGSTTGVAKLIIYTGLAGIGYGIGATGPSTAVQTVLADVDISSGIALLQFGGGVGPAIFIAIGQVIFANQLSNNLHGLLPGLGGSAVEGNGLSELVAQAPQGDAKSVVLGINQSVVQTWYLVIALGCASLLGSLSVEWRSVKKEDPNRDTKANNQALELGK